MNGEPHYTHYDKETKLKKGTTHTHTHIYTHLYFSIQAPLLPVIVFSKISTNRSRSLTARLQKCVIAINFELTFYALLTINLCFES